MNDALFVRRLERLGDLAGNRERLLERNGTASDSLREVFTLDQLHHERRETVALLETVDGGDVRMIQRRQHFGFALKPRHAGTVGGERRGQNLESDLALEPGVG